MSSKKQKWSSERYSACNTHTMIPFHKIYSALFKSFDLQSETNTIKHLISDGMSRVLIVKRSWIYALALIWVPLLLIVVASMNIITALIYHKDTIVAYSLIIGISISVLLFIFSVWNYLRHFRALYSTARVRTDFDTLMSELEQWDKYFMRFFDQTVLNQIIIIGLILWSGFSYIEHMRESWSTIIWLDIWLLFLQWILLGKYRKKMIDMEMDYNIVIPGKIMFVNQSGMLSSVNTIESDKVKTVSAKYSGWIGSFFNFGTIEIMTEWDSNSTGTLPMYYVTAPNETARLIQSMLDREHTKEPLIPIAPKLPADGDKATRIPKPPHTEKIGHKHISYDVKWTVRDVLE